MSQGEVEFKPANRENLRFAGYDIAFSLFQGSLPGVCHCICRTYRIPVKEISLNMLLNGLKAMSSFALCHCLGP